MILGFTNYSIDLVDDVRVVKVSVLNVVVVVVVVGVVVEGVSKFYSFLELSNLELAFLEPCSSLPSSNPKMYPKGDHARRRKHTTRSTKSGE